MLDFRRTEEHFPPERGFLSHTDVVARVGFGRLATALVAAAGVTAIVFAPAGGSGTLRFSGSPGELRPITQLERRFPGVASISARGSLVAIAGERPGKCGHIHLWSPTSGRFSSVTAGCSSSNGFDGITELALSRTLVAWVFSWGDRDSGDDCLMIRRVTSSRIEAAIARADHRCNVDYYAQRSVPAYEGVGNGGTTGASGSLLTALYGVADGVVYSEESYCNAAPSSCATPFRRVERSAFVSDGGVERQFAGRNVRVLAAAGHVAVALRSGSLDVVDVRTGAWRTLTTGSVRAARVDGNLVFVLRPKGLLDTYSLVSAARIARDQITASAQLADADRSFIAYVSGGRIHVRRRADHREVMLVARTAARTPLDAELDASGLYYSYNVPGKGSVGRVGLIPRAGLVRAFR
jgi:hypothetical protein